jgi:4,5-DOPA dioxygenase extradiol
VINWSTKAPHARRAHPSSDHFMPLLIVLGAAGEAPTSERIHSSFELGTLSMAAFAFHEAKSEKKQPSV